MKSVADGWGTLRASGEVQIDRDKELTQFSLSIQKICSLLKQEMWDQIGPFSETDCISVLLISKYFKTKLAPVAFIFNFSLCINGIKQWIKQLISY